MRDTYVFEYLNENDFKVKERSLKKYNSLAYKKLVFTYYKKLKTGEFVGNIIDTNKLNGTISYELKLPTDELFKKVHGEIRLHYSVYKDKNIILLTNLTPEGIFKEGHQAELGAYKGVMISKSNPNKDIFKIDLLNYLEK